MPSFDIVRRSEQSNSFVAAKIRGMFDLKNKHNEERFVGEIILPDKWNVGVIVGASGTGKTTIAKELFGDSYFVEPEFKGTSVIDDMPIRDAEMISKTFNSVGFSSPPSWLKPYSVLSNGEKMRVQLAYSIMQGSELVVFDEYTSVVDRVVAQVGSAAIQKAVRRANKKFVAVTCHYDVLDWLEPDWVFDTNTMRMLKRNFTDQKQKSQSQEKKDFGTFFKSITI